MINHPMEYQPKGGMCATCRHRDDDCSGLPFKDMQKIAKGDNDGVVIVRCTKYTIKDL